MDDNRTKAETLDPVAELRTLREEVRSDTAALYKWGRMLNALIELLQERGVASKEAVMERVYQRLDRCGATLGESAAPERGSDEQKRP